MNWGLLAVLLVIPNLFLLVIGASHPHTSTQTFATNLQLLVLVVQIFALYKYWKEMY